MSGPWHPKNWEEACKRNAGRRKLHQRKRKERADRIVRLLAAGAAREFVWLVVIDGWNDEAEQSDSVSRFSVSAPHSRSIQSNVWSEIRSQNRSDSLVVGLVSLWLQNARKLPGRLLESSWAFSLRYARGSVGRGVLWIRAKRMET